MLLLLAGAVPPPLAPADSPDESPSAVSSSAAGAPPVAVVVLPAASAPPRNQPNRSASAPDVAPAACNRWNEHGGSSLRSKRAVQVLLPGQWSTACLFLQAPVPSDCRTCHVVAQDGTYVAGTSFAGTATGHVAGHLKHSLGRCSHLSVLNRRPPSGRRTASPAARAQLTSALPSCCPAAAPLQPLPPHVLLPLLPAGVH